jgi:hypothetical protein
MLQICADVGHYLRDKRPGIRLVARSAQRFVAIDTKLRHEEFAKEQRLIAARVREKRRAASEDEREGTSVPSAPPVAGGAEGSPREVTERSRLPSNGDDARPSGGSGAPSSPSASEGRRTRGGSAEDPSTGPSGGDGRERTGAGDGAAASGGSGRAASGSSGGRRPGGTEEGKTSDRQRGSSESGNPLKFLLGL